VVQLYVSHKNPTIFKAALELKGFEKVVLKPGESKSVSFTLGKRAFAYYNTEIADWHVESGEYELRIGASVSDIRGSVTVKLKSSVDVIVPDFSKSAPIYYNLENGIENVSDEQFMAVLNKFLPSRERDKHDPFDENATLCEISGKLIGRIFANKIKKESLKTLGNMSDDIQTMFANMFDDMPLRSIRMMAGEKMPPQFVEGLLTALNGQVIKGLKMMK